MSISRRKLLQTIAALPATTIYTPSAFSCGDGVSKEKPDHVKFPASDFLSDNSDDGIEKFLNEKYGRNKWTYSTSAIVFRTKQIAENPHQIPIEIGTGDSLLAGQFRSLAVFVQRIVGIEKSSGGCSPYCWSHRSMISRVAEFKLSKDVIPDISIRIRIADSNALKMTVFTPVDENQYIEVVKQNESIKLPRCSLEIDGYVL